MEEDKVIEKLLNIFEMLRKDDEEGHSSAYELQWEDIQAIQNLIARYKELENKNKSLKKEIGLMKSVNINDNFIPKSKVKEKIEEIFEILDKIPQVIIELNGNVMTVKHDIAEILQELLEGDK